MALDAVEGRPNEVKEFAEKAGAAVNTIYNLRTTAKAWPSTLRGSISYRKLAKAWPSFGARLQISVANASG